LGLSLLALRKKGVYMAHQTAKRALLIAVFLIVGTLVITALNTNTLVSTGNHAWDRIHLEALSWDGPQETLTTSSGRVVILQWEPEDQNGMKKTCAVLDKAFNRAEYWGPIERPVTLRLYKDPLVLKWIDSSFLMQPAGRAFNDLVFIISPSSDVNPTLRNPRRLEDLLAHELTHTWLFQAVGGYGPVFTTIPSWFVEGMAEYVENPVSSRNVLDIQREVDGDPTVLISDWWAFYIVNPEGAYLSSKVVFEELVENGGKDNVLELVDLMGAGMSFDRAFHQIYGIDPDEFIFNWWERSPYYLRLWEDYPDTTPISEEKLYALCTRYASQNVQIPAFRDPCSIGFERMHACPKELPGLCVSEFEHQMRMHENVIMGPANPLMPAWASDCKCMDEGPTR
jgi:hypothetical protein